MYMFLRCMSLLWSLFRSDPLPVYPLDLHGARTEGESAPTGSAPRYIDWNPSSSSLTLLNSSASAGNATSLGRGIRQALAGGAFPVSGIVIAVIAAGTSRTNNVDQTNTRAELRHRAGNSPLCLFLLERHIHIMLPFCLGICPPHWRVGDTSGFNIG